MASPHTLSHFKPLQLIRDAGLVVDLRQRKKHVQLFVGDVFICVLPNGTLKHSATYQKTVAGKIRARLNQMGLTT